MVDLLHVDYLPIVATTPQPYETEVAMDGSAGVIPGQKGNVIPGLSETVDTAKATPEELCEEKRAYAQSLVDVEWVPFEDTVNVTSLQGWEDDWISQGKFDNTTYSLESPKVDVVYTFVESTDAFKAMKAPYDEAYGRLTDKKWANAQARRTRSWDELRYSIRATLRFGAAWLSKIHIVAKDFEQVDNDTQAITRIVQYPNWLDQSKVNKASSLIMVTPESAILHNDECGQTFNSVTVEGALVNVPIESKHFIAFSDDMMFGRKISSSDFVSPLHGISISTYHDIWALDEDRPPDLTNGETGEGHPARFTSYLLAKRFGRRIRRLTIHMPKIIDREILAEALDMFPRPAKITTLSRYRDDSQQLYMWFLHASYAMERHREAVLWALAMSVDTNQDGIIQLDEKQALIDRITSGRDAPQRDSGAHSMVDRINQDLIAANLEPLETHKSVAWTSMDGPEPVRHLTPEQCQESFSIDTCLGSEFVNGTANPYSLNTLFEQISNSEIPVSCGDCLIKYLLQNSAVGYSSILPTKESKYRASAVAAIYKYRYTLTFPENDFKMIRFPQDAATLPKLADNMPGLICINDDITVADGRALSEVGNYYHEFFERAFPGPSEYEKAS